MEHQIVVRIDTPLRDALMEDAERNGRTLAQTVRFLLRQSYFTEARINHLLDLAGWPAGPSDSHGIDP